MCDLKVRDGGRIRLPEIVTGYGNVSSVVSTATQQKLARRGLGFAPGIMVAGPDFLAAHLEVAAAGHGTLVLAVVMEIAIVVVIRLHRVN